MLEPIKRELRARAGGLALASLMVVIAVACATPGSDMPVVDEVASISDVLVEHEEGATVVVLVGLDAPVFTAFQEQDPDRVVVDLASVEPSHLMDALEVYDGVVDEVTVSPFSTGTGDPMTRVEVSLAQEGVFRVDSTPKGLEIRVEGWASDVDDMAMEDDWESPAVDEEDPWAIEPAAEAAPSAGWHADPATRLTGIDARATDGGSGAVVHLIADGVVSSVVTFTLEDPDRLVIDLPDLAAELSEKPVEVSSQSVERVRWGRHEDRVRVVIDGGEFAAGFSDRHVVPAPDGLMIALGSGEETLGAVAAVGQMASPSDDARLEAMMDDAVELEVAAEEQAMEAELAEMAPAAVAEEDTQMAVNTVYAVEWSGQDDRDRVLVMSESPVDYLIYEPDAETVVLSVQHAVITDEAAVRITPVPAQSVSLVTSFAQPDVEASEVRVVVKRAAGLAPMISREGSVLVMDFVHQGGVAATPPVMDSVPAMETASDEMAEATTSEMEEVAMAVMEPTAEEMPAALSENVASDAVEMAKAMSEASGSTMVVEPTPAAAPAPDAVPAALEPPAAITILSEGGLFDGKEYIGRRISLDFKDVEIADVLRLVAEVSDLNVIAGDEVAGRVTIRLVDVPWDQALDVILLTKGLGFQRVGNVLRIAPTTVLKQEEELRLQERRNLESLQDLVVKLQPVNYADVKKVNGMIAKLLSPRGTVNTDERTNTIIIKDIPTVVDEAVALIKAIDTQTPQVMIEAKIVEANLEFSREFGSLWSFGSQPLVDGFDDNSGPRSDLGGNNFRLHEGSFSQPGVGASSNSVAFGNGITALPNALVNMSAFLLDDKLNLELQLQAAEVNGDGKVISSPRVVTLDNTEALIEQGVSIPFQTFENGDAQLEFVDAVLQLKVTPHITGDRSIIMDVGVSRNAPDDSVFTLTGSPAIAKNQVKTVTLVSDGQTLVLGGIYVIDKSHRQSRVPYLHEIPVLGRAFRSDEISDSRKELLIFVTPQVVLVPPTAS